MDLEKHTSICFISIGLISFGGCQHDALFGEHLLAWYYDFG